MLYHILSKKSFLTSIILKTLFYYIKYQCNLVKKNLSYTIYGASYVIWYYKIIIILNNYMHHNLYNIYIIIYTIYIIYI